MNRINAKSESGLISSVEEGLRGVGENLSDGHYAVSCSIV